LFFGFFWFLGFLGFAERRHLAGRTAGILPAPSAHGSRLH
jgi:hypothetical protein